MSARIVPLAEAVAELVHDGDTVALEGFTHLIPFAAGHEIARQRRRDLTLIRMTPDLIYDQLIGMACARKLIFSWGGNPGVGWGDTYNFSSGLTYTFGTSMAFDGHFGWVRMNSNVEMSDLSEDKGSDWLGIPGTNGPNSWEGGMPFHAPTSDRLDGGQLTKECGASGYISSVRSHLFVDARPAPGVTEAFATLLTPGSTDRKVLVTPGA